MLNKSDPYLDLIIEDIDKILSSSRSKTIKHQSTCPTCGYKLVNLYSFEGVWACKKCWDIERNLESLER